MAGLAIRYVTLPAPLLTAAYLTWCLYGAFGARRFVQNLMLAVACAVLAINVQQGAGYGLIRTLQTESILNDIRAGLTLDGSRAVDHSTATRVSPTPTTLSGRTRIANRPGRRMNRSYCGASRLVTSIQSWSPSAGGKLVCQRRSHATIDA